MAKAEEFLKVLEKHKGERNLIVLRGAPDPDSIGAAMAQKYMANHFDIESQIIYNQSISHQENRALIKKLDLDLIQYKGNDLNKMREFHTYSIVDSHIQDIPWLEVTKEIPALSVIDHHKRSGNVFAEFVDIREDVGSTCTIMTEFIKTVMPFTDITPELVILATALVYGIRTDTDNLVEAFPKDFEAMSYLATHADKELLKSISSQSMTPATMNIIQKALENKKIANTFLTSCVGYVRKDDRDAIPQAADFLLKREGIETVLVYGIIDNYIDGSLRTRSNTLEPTKFISDTFGTILEGGEYGGRKNKGGFKIPLGFLADYKNALELELIVSKHMEDKLFNKIGVAPEGDEK